VAGRGDCLPAVYDRRARPSPRPPGSLKHKLAHDCRADAPVPAAWAIPSSVKAFKGEGFWVRRNRGDTRAMGALACGSLKCVRTVPAAKLATVLAEAHEAFVQLALLLHIAGRFVESAVEVAFAIDDKPRSPGAAWAE
jgi:hypothetical protein